MAIKQSKELTPVESALVSAGRKFRNIATSDSDLAFAQEKLHIMGIIAASKDGDYSLKLATPESIGSALLQAASLGLTFNPTLAHCYLIPRRMNKGDRNSPLIAYASPGYRGLVHLAVQADAILWCKAEVVYEKDVFRYRGTIEEPLHEYDPFKPRGKKIGVYCLAKTPDGAYLTEFMSEEQVEAVRKMSEAPNSIMWTKFDTEGWKKAVIRRAQKTWPRRNPKAMERFDQAVRILNDHEGIVLDGKSERIEDEPVISDEQVTTLHAICTDRGMEPERASEWLRKLARTYRVAAIENVPASKFDEAKTKLTEAVKAWKPKEVA